MNSLRAVLTKLTLVALALTGCLIFSSGAPAALQHAGDLDPAFGSGGTVFTSSGILARCNQLFIQSDGKIVAVGMGGGQQSIFAAYRYNPNGTLDPTFGSGGIALKDVGGNGESAFAGALQPDGKIIVAGSVSIDGPQPSAEFALTRFNPDGSLDITFGVNGVVLTPVGNLGEIFAIALQPDGKIVAGGTTLTGVNDSLSAIAMARYDSNGILDPSFGTGGTLAIDFPNGASVQALAIQPDLKIVAGGAGLSPVERFNTDGSIDTGFGVNGFAPSPVFANDFICKGLALQSDGKIVPAGLLFTISGQVFGVARYNSNGFLDSGFGSGGLTQQNLGGLNFANAVVIAPSGNIIAVGESMGTLTAQFPPEKFAILELQPNGSPNPAFGSGGMVVSDFGRPAGANSVAIQSDGNIVVGGFAALSESTPFPFQVALARYIGVGTTPVFCLRDNTSPITLQLTQAGDYSFKNCTTGQTLSGTGTVRIVNNVLMLTDNRIDRRISASFFLNQLTGSATITLIPAPGIFQTTRINDTVPNASCSCP